MQSKAEIGSQTPTVDDVRRLLEGVSILHTAAGRDRAGVLADCLLGLLGAKVAAVFAGGVGGDLVRLGVRSTDPARGYDPPPPPRKTPPGVTLLEPDGSGPAGIVSLVTDGKRATVLAAWQKKPFEPRQATLLQLFHPAVTWAIVAPPVREGLSAGAEAVLELMLTGLPEKEIARRLGRSAHTVHSHVKRVYKHYEVSSRPELIVRLNEPAR